MPIKTDELRTKPVAQMPTPAELTAQFPLSDAVSEHILQSRRQVEDILSGKDDKRLLVVVGPCSIHDPEAAIDYAEKLKDEADKYASELFIVMRTYFEKPRTVVGWKGLINDPGLDNTYDIARGLATARKLLVDINGLGMPTATEFLDMITGQYLADLISWGAIGARTTESQIHREMASALSCPVGFKNGTDGNVKIAVDAVRAAHASHMFCSPDKDGRMTIYRTEGNPYGHVILRGGKQPNYHRHDVVDAASVLTQFDLPGRLIVDFSHANCQKQHKLQLNVAEDIGRQIREGDNHIAGIMAESFLVEGNQVVTSPSTLNYGQSITDPCIGWNDTQRMLDVLASAVAAR